MSHCGTPSFAVSMPAGPLVGCLLVSEDVFVVGENFSASSMFDLPLAGFHLLLHTFAEAGGVVRIPSVSSLIREGSHVAQ